MKKDTLSTVIDALIDYGISEEEAICLISKLIKEEASHIIKYMNKQNKSLL